MESEELSALRRAIAAERSKNKQLTKQLNCKLSENSTFVCVIQKEQMFSGSTVASIQLENRAANLKRMLNQEEGIANSLQSILQQMIQEKLQLETVLEQERERSIETMSQQIAQALSEKLYFPLSDLERRVQSQSASDTGSAAEESVDSSFSSDSGREREERKRRKLIESELAYWKQQLRLAKKEIRKDKEMYRQLQLNQQKTLAENSELAKSEEGGQ